MDTKKSLLQEISSSEDSDSSEDRKITNKFEIKDTVTSIFRKTNKSSSKQENEFTQGLVTGFKNSKSVSRRRQEVKSPMWRDTVNSSKGSRVKSISKNDYSIRSSTRSKYKPTVHHKTPRKGKFKNLVLFSKRQKLQKIKYFADMKKRHFESFLNSFKKGAKGNNIDFKPGEKSEIMHE